MAESQHHTDLRLIASYKVSEDLEVLGKLYKTYMHLVYGVCLKYLKDREESQDAVMLIFEKLIDQVKKHQIDNFKSWLYVIAKNHCLMTLRSKKYKLSRQQQDIDIVNVESSLLLHHSDESLLEDDLTKLEKCIEELQNEQKQCVALFYLEKKPYAVIAKETAFELNKVKSYIQNGKRNLKTCMDKRSG